MAYDINFPADDSYLSDFPAGDREQNRALKDDQIVNAGRLRGLTVGNENGQIPINNGTENTNLNAALLNGKESSYFATSNHTHTTATQSSNGYMSNADKKKLDGIASGAEVNQNAFANVKVGSTTIQSDAKQDTLELAAGTNISLVGDANNDKVTIGVTGKVASASQADNATNATKATQDGSGNTITTHYLSRNQSTQNDMNACTVEGIYRFSGTLSNAWTGTSWGTLLVLNNQYNGGSGVGGTYLVQMAFPTDGKIYMRQRVNTGAWTGWVALARTSDNVASATKATQDSDGNAINTTYLKRSGGTMGGALNLANGTLNLAGDDCYFGDQNIAGGFCLKGANGATNLTFIDKDNAAQKASLSYTGGDLISSATIRGNIIGTATNANNLVISDGTSAHIKYGGGDVDENTAISQNKVNLLIGSWYSTGFRDLCSIGNPIRVAINHRNGNIKTTGNVTANGAMYSATPGTGDNSTRVATTAFVQGLISSLKGSIGGTIVASNLAQNGYVKFSNGLILQWGTIRGSCKQQGKGKNSTTIPYPISFTQNYYFINPKTISYDRDYDSPSTGYVNSVQYTLNGIYLEVEVVGNRGSYWQEVSINHYFFAIGK